METKKYAWEIGVSEAVKMGVTEEVYHEIVEELEKACEDSVAMLLMEATWVAEKELGISDRLPLAFKDENANKSLTADIIAFFRNFTEEHKDAISEEDYKALNKAFNQVARTFHYCETSYNQKELDIFLSGKIKAMTHEEYINWCKNKALVGSIEAYAKFEDEKSKLTA